MKKLASKETVLAFIAAVYPDAPALAVLAFDEETVLTEATRQLTESNVEIKTLLQDILEHIEHQPDAWSQSGAWQTDEREKLVERVREALE